MGGVAAGKSAVAAAFAERGLVAIDADRIAHEVLARPETAAAIAHEFGDAVLDSGGAVDRPALGRIVFADAAARVRLEAITHPPIREAVLAAIDAARGRGDSVLLDAPLLLERGLIEHCDRTVFVAAAAKTRQARAAARGWERDELLRREAAQAPLDDKRAAADFTIDNDGTLDDMRRQVDDLLRRLAAGA